MKRRGDRRTGFLWDVFEVGVSGPANFWTSDRTSIRAVVFFSSGLVVESRVLLNDPLGAAVVPESSRPSLGEIDTPLPSHSFPVSALIAFDWDMEICFSDISFSVFMERDDEATFLGGRPRFFFVGMFWVSFSTFRLICFSDEASNNLFFGGRPLFLIGRSTTGSVSCLELSNLACPFLSGMADFLATI